MLMVAGVEVLDVREAAEYVGRTPETVRRWVWSGKVSAVRQGNRLLIPRTELDEATGARSQSPLSLRDWAADVPRSATREAASAAALVQEDRGDDHGR